LVKKLLAIRAVKGLSQQEVAAYMQCSQSRISKFEQSDDADLRLGDLRGYLNAIGLDIHGIIAPKDWTIADQIKFYACQVMERLAQLRELAEKDQEICKGVHEFHFEALYNFLRGIIDSAKMR